MLEYHNCIGGSTLKKVICLFIILTILLGISGLVFASKESDGEKLQRAGFITGDANGNLMESNMLTRAELTVLVAELNGVKENAKTYAIQSSFNDVYPYEWYGPYVSYAEKEGWFKGDSNGNFNPNDPVSNQMMATVMLRTLEYDSTWNTALLDAQSIGVAVNAQVPISMTRGEAFSSLWRVVNTPKKGSSTAIGIELGKLESNNKINIDMPNSSEQVLNQALQGRDVLAESQAIDNQIAKSKTLYLESEIEADYSSIEGYFDDSERLIVADHTIMGSTGSIESKYYYLNDGLIYLVVNKYSFTPINPNRTLVEDKKYVIYDKRAYIYDNDKYARTEDLKEYINESVCLKDSFDKKVSEIKELYENIKDEKSDYLGKSFQDIVFIYGEEYELMGYEGWVYASYRDLNIAFGFDTTDCIYDRLTTSYTDIYWDGKICNVLTK